QVVDSMATEAGAKEQKADGSDWSKQMLVVVTGGVKPSGGWKIEIVSVTRGDKGGTVTWQLTPPKGAATAAFTHPAAVALVDRVEGEVRFAAPATGKLNPQPEPKRQPPQPPTPGGEGKEPR